MFHPLHFKLCFQVHLKTVRSCFIWCGIQGIACLPSSRFNPPSWMLRARNANDPAQVDVVVIAACWKFHKCWWSFLSPTPKIDCFFPLNDERCIVIQSARGTYDRYCAGYIILIDRPTFPSATVWKAGEHFLVPPPPPLIPTTIERKTLSFSSSFFSSSSSSSSQTTGRLWRALSRNFFFWPTQNVYTHKIKNLPSLLYVCVCHV